MGGLDLCSIVAYISERHYQVSVAHLRDWSAGNEIICHSTNAQPATFLMQPGSGALTRVRVISQNMKGKVICPVILMFI